MNRIFALFLIAVVQAVCFAASPSLESFDTNQFGSLADKHVAIKSGVITTNLEGRGLILLSNGNTDSAIVTLSGTTPSVTWTNRYYKQTVAANTVFSFANTPSDANLFRPIRIDVTGDGVHSFTTAETIGWRTGTNFDAGAFIFPADETVSILLEWNGAQVYGWLDPDPVLAALGGGGSPTNTTLTYLTITNVLNVRGNAHFASSVDITNSLTVYSNTYVSNIFATTQFITNSLTVYSNTYVSNIYSFTGVVSNNLTVLGNTALNTATAQSLTVTNNLTVQGSYQGTIDPSVSGTTLNVQKSLKLQFPRYVDNAGCTYANTNDYTSLTFMLPLFSGSAATNANYCDFAFRVPADLDTSKDLTGSLTIRLSGADTGAHTYDVGMVSIANSSAAAGTPANYVALTISGDGSGASGDIESVSGVTLTSWRSNMTAGQYCLLRLNRDGANDASTVASNLMELEIFYWATQ